MVADTDEADTRVIEHDENESNGAALRTLLSAAENVIRAYWPLVLLNAVGQHEQADIARIAESALDGKTGLEIGGRYLTTTATLTRRSLTNGSDRRCWTR